MKVTHLWCAHHGIATNYTKFPLHENILGGKVIDDLGLEAYKNRFLFRSTSKERRS